MSFLLLLQRFQLLPARDRAYESFDYDNGGDSVDAGSTTGKLFARNRTTWWLA
jgi:hypothetical protein